MKEGHEIAWGTPFELRSYTGQNRIQIKFDRLNHTVYCVSELKLDFPSLTITEQGNSILLEDENISDQFAVINRWMLDQNIRFHAIEVMRPTIENIFMTLVSKNKEVSL